MNAIKHGLNSTRPVISGMESEEDWECHLAAILEQYQPAGYVEESLAHRIAENEWRLRRAARAETEHLNVIQERAALQMAEGRTTFRDPIFDALAPILTGVVDNMDLPLAENRHRIWQNIRDASDDDSLPESDADCALFDATLYVQARLARPSQSDQITTPPTKSSRRRKRKPRQGKDPGDSAANTPPSEMPAITVANIKLQLEELLQANNALFGASQIIFLMFDIAAQRVARLRRMAFHERHDLDHYRRRHLLPDDPTMRTVIRSESHYRKMLEKDVAELERLQAMRRARQTKPSAVGQPDVTTGSASAAPNEVLPTPDTFTT